MPAVLTHGSSFSVALDKGVLVPPVESVVEVDSRGLCVLEQEAAVQSDIEATLTKLIAGLMYEQGPFKVGFVTYNQVSKITLSELSKKGTAPLVLKGELECTLIVMPALNPANGMPDAAPPTKAIITFAEVQAQYHTK